eukprot:Seg1599.1 transcript_id=Seg1599.1/GoldUCD/mRNA.D3Y31 product="2-oxoglutarate-dependent dioxygenase tropC" protein_id=Seg1599.1/GoldUCD/D3Y31
MDRVQIIDISAFTSPNNLNDEAKAKVLKAWDDAFQTLGFAIITGHGVPPQAIQDIQADAREFFEQDMDIKMKSCLNTGYGKGGFVPMGVESVARSKDRNEKPSDYVENICFFNGGNEGDIVPDSPARFKASVQKYDKCMMTLLSKIMEISALCLGLPKDFFTEYHTRPENAIRLAHYPAQDKTAPKPNQVRYGAHTDYTGFTILRPDEQIGGLQVLDPEKESWIPVEYVEDSFIVNAGDLIQQWTNDHWISNLHRVVSPPEGLRHKDRLSVVYFTGPNPDAVITPLEVCCGGKPPKYEPVVASDYLMRKLNATNV